MNLNKKEILDLMLKYSLLTKYLNIFKGLSPSNLFLNFTLELVFEAKKKFYFSFHSSYLNKVLEFLNNFKKETENLNLIQFKVIFEFKGKFFIFDYKINSELKEKEFRDALGLKEKEFFEKEDLDVLLSQSVIFRKKCKILPMSFLKKDGEFYCFNNGEKLKEKELLENYVYSFGSPLFWNNLYF